MEEAPGGTPVGVDDPYAHVDRCDHLTDDGRCRFARDRAESDPDFAAARRRDDYRCPVAGAADESGLTGPWEWVDCPHFEATSHDRECARCGLAARPMAHGDERPLIEEHHLSYADGGSSDRDATAADEPVDAFQSETPAHEITVPLCRWCHATVHQSWGRIDDDVNPDPEAIAERERRRSREADELAFDSAADRYDGEYHD